MGPCMCGDLYCGSCGPAQGNNRCVICGTWTADGGCARPAYCNASARKWEERWAQQEAEWEKAEREREHEQEKEGKA